MDKVIEAIEKVFAQRPTPPRPPKATLRDLLDLDCSYDISESDTELGDVLRLLDTKTLVNLEHFLYEQREEAMERQYCSERKYAYLCSVIGITAFHSSPSVEKELTTPVLAAMLAEDLRQKYPHITERAIEATVEERLGVSRSTQKRWRERMEEVGMTWWSFNDAQLEYVALGKRRGPKPQS